MYLVPRDSIRVVRFTNIEIVESLEGVVAERMDYLPGSNHT